MPRSTPPLRRGSPRTRETAAPANYLDWKAQTADTFEHLLAPGRIGPLARRWKNGGT